MEGRLRCTDELIFPPGAVEVDKDVELSVDNNPNLYSKSLMPISLIISCKPSKFRKPIKVRLASWLRPRDGRDIKVAVLSRSTSQMEWKRIKEATLTTLGFIEYEGMHFSEHTAGISDEEAKRGSIHFYNDVRINLGTGSILSFLCRDKKSLDECVEGLKPCYDRIIALPTEIDIPIDGYIKMEMSCISPPAMKMNLLGESPVKMKKVVLGVTYKFDFYFYPNPRPSELNHQGFYELFYIIEVMDAQNKTVGEANRIIPLSYKLPQTEQLHSQAQDVRDTKPVEPRQPGLNLSKNNPELKSSEGPDTSQKPQDHKEALGVVLNVNVVAGGTNKFSKDVITAGNVAKDGATMKISQTGTTTSVTASSNQGPSSEQ